MKEILPHIKFIYKRNIRDKKNIYYIIMMSLCSLLLLCILMFQHMRNNSKEWVLDHVKEMRQIIVAPGYDESMKFFSDKSYDFKIDELRKIPHVVDIHSSDYDFAILEDLKIDDIQGSDLWVYYGAEGVSPKIIKGESFDIKDRDVMICPNKFYPNSYMEDPDEKDLIDGDRILGKTLKGIHSVKIYDEKSNSFIKQNKEHEFKIIGLYNAEEYASHYATCYIPGRQLEEMIETAKGPIDYVTNFIVTIDSIENKPEVIEAFRARDYTANNRAYYDKNEQHRINQTYYFILGVSLISILLVSLAYIKKKIINNLSTTALAKSLGYNKNQIRSFYLVDNALITTTSYILSLVLFTIAAIIIKKFFYMSLNRLGAEWNISMYPFIITFASMLICSSLVNYYYISKRIRKTPIGVLNGETI